MTKVIELPAREVNFDQAAADAGKWRSVAISLLFAAEKLWKQVRAGLLELDHVSGRTRDLSDSVDIQLRLRGPFFLLAGMAVENLLKALIVKRMRAAGEAIVEKDVLTLQGRKHNLVTLADKAGIKKSDEETEVLTRLSTFVQWAGRYPVPIKRRDAQSSRTTRSDDYARISLFVSRLEKEFRK